MESQSDLPRWAAIAEQPPQSPRKFSRTRWIAKESPGTSDPHNFSEQSGRRKSRIGLGHGIATSDKPAFFSALEAVQVKAVVAERQDDLPRLDVLNHAACDLGYVAGPQGRQHAGPPDLQAEVSALA